MTNKLTIGIGAIRRIMPSIVDKLGVVRMIRVDPIAIAAQMPKRRGRQVALDSMVAIKCLRDMPQSQLSISLLEDHALSLTPTLLGWH